MKKTLIFLAIIISLLIINNLIHSIIDLWQKQSFLTSASQSLSREEEKNRQLQAQLKKVSQEQFVEEQARDKLLLVKPGEEIILLPTGMIAQSGSASQASATAKPHWQEWWDLFFQ
ncbi:MAG TPA: septum formation initiator family protein [Patescibacteria group bacterium]|nr:septum formation initiator family protein [Patescibacteria group bacterium]